MSIEKRLHEASLSGNVDLLNQLMAEDRLSLARSSTICFNETPLHVAAMLGHLDFAQALVLHRPELAIEVDYRRSTPLHLASANGYVEIVKLLLQVNPDACLVRDEDGRTPLHLAVMKGRVDVAEELIRVKKLEVTECCLNATGETLLHMAVKYNRFDCLKMLVERVGESQNILNTADDNGNTVLHLAVCLKQTETVKYLLELGAKVTADPVISSSRTIHHTSRIIHHTSRNARSSPQPDRQENDWTEKNFASLTVAATVIASMAYQAILNPPGGIWTDVPEIHAPVGTSIGWTTSKISAEIFWICNTVSFISSLSVLFLLVSGLRFKGKFLVWVLMVCMWITITSMAICYLVSMAALEPTRRYILNSVSATALIVWLLLLFGVVLVYPVRFFVRKRGLSRVSR